MKKDCEIKPAQVHDVAGAQEAKETINQCIEQLSQSDIGDSNWLEATRVLGQIDPQFAGLQFNAVAEDQYQVCRALAVSLSRLGPSIFPDAIRALQHAHPNVRQFAAGLLYGLHQRGDVDIELAVVPLSHSLLDLDCRVRVKAAITLSFIGVKAVAAIPNLVTALSDKEDWPPEKWQ